MSEQIRVHDEFSRSLHSSYLEFNRRMKLAYGREIDFTEYTRLISQDLVRTVEPVQNPVLLPILWGRKGLKFDRK